jgi:beta-glucanase (GH16 family)
VGAVAAASFAEGAKPADPDAKRPYSTNAWELVWSDEFNGAGLPDEKLWSPEVGFLRNQEPQYYTSNRLENCCLKDGCLVITAREEKWANPEWKDRRLGGWKREREFADYTSASIRTAGKKSFLYGRIEVRAQMPSSFGAWPAIWTLGESLCYEKDAPEYWNWPACGEIDIVELWANQSNRVAACLHTSKDSVREKAAHTVIGGGDLYLKPDHAPWNGFHVYTLDWDADNIYMYYDGQQYGRAKIARGDWPDVQNPFRKPHFLILNLALGGYGNKVCEKSVFPMEFKVDYVRYYQKKTR